MASAKGAPRGGPGPASGYRSGRQVAHVCLDGPDSSGIPEGRSNGRGSRMNLWGQVAKVGV